MKKNKCGWLIYNTIGECYYETSCGQKYDIKAKKGKVIGKKCPDCGKKIITNFRGFLDIGHVQKRIKK